MQTINVIRRRTHQLRPGLSLQFDYWLLLAVGGLLVLGLLMVYSTTFDYGFLFKDDTTYYIRRQLQAAAIGITIAIGILFFDYHLLRKLSVPLLIGTLFLLAFLLFFGEAIFGAIRGLSEGSYQPSELAKLATILYIAHWLSSKGERIKDVTYGLLPFSLITGIVCALIVRQPDLSTAVLIAITSFAVFFVAGADWRQFIIVGLVGGAVFLFLVSTLPHARNRVDAYTAALQDPLQAHWHVQQSLIALGTGNWFGVGLGRGTQKFGPLPAAHTDGVFAVLGEELGLIGAILAISLFGLFIWRGMLTAKRARDPFGALLAFGITAWLGFQALINLAVITAVIPFTGIPLPFMSYGGTSLAFSLIAVGILLNISRDSALGRVPQEQTPLRAAQTPPKKQPSRRPAYINEQ
jgi:cell division protein FtsW